MFLGIYRHIMSRGQMAAMAHRLHSAGITLARISAVVRQSKFPVIQQLLKGLDTLRNNLIGDHTLFFFFLVVKPCGVRQSNNTKAAAPGSWCACLRRLRGLTRGHLENYQSCSWLKELSPSSASLFQSYLLSHWMATSGKLVWKSYLLFAAWQAKVFS